MNAAPTRDSVGQLKLLFVTLRYDRSAFRVNDVVRSAAACCCVLEIKVHMPAVRFAGHSNDESRQVSIDSVRIDAGNAQHFIRGKLRRQKL